MTTKPDANPIPDPVETPSPTDVVIEAWFLETFHNVSQLSTEHFNKFREAADRLKARLRQKES